MCKDHAAMTGHASATAHVQDTTLLSQVLQINDSMSDWWISVEVQSRSIAIIIQLLLLSRLLCNCHYC